GASVAYPFIFHKDGGSCSDTGQGDGCWTPDYDPACDERNPSNGSCAGGGEQGSLSAISAVDLGGRYAGWAAGSFGAASPPDPQDADYSAMPGAKGSLLRLDPDRGSWRAWTAHDASKDYLGPPEAIQGLQLASVRT